jgi:hypothetical protein
MLVMLYRVRCPRVVRQPFGDAESVFEADGSWTTVRIGLAALGVSHSGEAASFTTTAARIKKYIVEAGMYQCHSMTDEIR